MWVQGEETYLGVRTFLGVSKISLHSTGHWALVTGTGRVRINGPRRLNGDWTAGPRIVYPGLHPRTPLSGLEAETKRPVVLFEDPPGAHWRDFAVLFARPTAKVSDLVGLMPSGIEVIGPLPHRSGASVWLATFVARMTQEEQEYIRAERSKFQVTVRSDPEAVKSAVAILVQDTTGGDTMLVNIALGRENLILQGS